MFAVLAALAGQMALKCIVNFMCGLSFQSRPNKAVENLIDEHLLIYNVMVFIVLNFQVKGFSTDSTFAFSGRRRWSAGTTG